MSTQQGDLVGAPLEAWLDELVADAAKCGRLTEWERNFLASVAQRRRHFSGRLQLWPDQMRKLREIEEKIHAAG